VTTAKCGCGFLQYWINNDLWYKESEGPIMIVYGIKWKCEGPQQATDIEVAYSSQTVQRAVQSEGRRMVGRKIIGTALYCCDKMKITDKCTYSEGSNKKLHVRT